MLLSVALALAIQAAVPKPKYAFTEPPRARLPASEIEAVIIAPLFAEPFQCGEHHAGEQAMAGDALGTDCQVLGGALAENRSYGQLYRTDGKRNEDWYSWGANVLAPADGIIVGLLPNPRINTPGAKGRPPAGLMQFKRDDGVVITYAHLSDFKVALGDRVKAGQVVAKVGNNGPSYAPHVHVGAARGDVPLQIRWDLRAMARLRRR